MSIYVESTLGPLYTVLVFDKKDEFTTYDQNRANPIVNDLVNNDCISPPFDKETVYFEFNIKEEDEYLAGYIIQRLSEFVYDKYDNYCNIQKKFIYDLMSNELTFELEYKLEALYDPCEFQQDIYTPEQSDDEDRYNMIQSESEDENYYDDSDNDNNEEDSFDIYIGNTIPILPIFSDLGHIFQHIPPPPPLVEYVTSF